MMKLDSSLRTASTVLVWTLALGCGLFWTATAVGGQTQTVLTQKQVPIKITKSGSYVLGGNLKVTDPTVDAILVTADNVTIDLAGFTIEGPPHGPTSSGSAIESVATWNVVVKNGMIRGFYEIEAACIHLTGHGNRVENVHVTECGWTAIYADGVVTGCEVTNSVGGIGGGRGSVISDNMLFAVGTGLHGSGDGGVTIARNTLTAANGLGLLCIYSEGANRIEDNTCSGYWYGLSLTGGTNLYSRNFIYGAEEPLVDGGPPNIDGGTIDPALSNVIVSETP